MKDTAPDRPALEVQELGDGKSYITRTIQVAHSARGSSNSPPKVAISARRARRYIW